MNYWNSDATCNDTHKKADIYCYGMTVLEALAKRKPWHLLSVADIEANVVKGLRPEPTPAMVSLIQTDSVYRTLYDIVKKCWNHDASARPSASAIADEIGNMRSK